MKKVFSFVPYLKGICILVLLSFCLQSSAAPTNPIVTLQWDESIDAPYLTSYIVYYSTTSGSPYTPTSKLISYSLDGGLTFVDQNIPAPITVDKSVTQITLKFLDGSQPYYFALKAVDTRGLESEFSNEVATSNTPPEITVLKINGASDPTDVYTNVANGQVHVGIEAFDNVTVNQYLILDSLSTSFDPDPNKGTFTSFATFLQTQDTQIPFLLFNNIDGNRSIYAWVKDNEGAISSLPAIKTNVILDRVPPDPPAGLNLDAADDTGISNSDSITSKTTGLTIKGTGEPGATVSLHDWSVPIAGASAVVAAGGTFSIDIDLVEDIHSITAYQTDPAGNTSAVSGFLIITVDTTSPRVSGAGVIDLTHVDVSFSEAVNDGATLARYAISRGIAISSVQDQGGNKYRLTTTTAMSGPYTVTVNTATAMTDVAGNELLTAYATAQFTAFSINVVTPVAPFYDPAAPANGVNLVTSGSTPRTATFSGVGGTSGKYRWSLSSFGAINSTTADTITYTAPAGISGTTQKDTLTLTDADNPTILKDSIVINIYNPLAVTWPTGTAAIVLGDNTKTVTATGGKDAYAFQSSNTAFATVNATTGVITPVAPGTFTILVRDTAFGDFGTDNGFRATTPQIEVINAIVIGGKPANDVMESGTTNQFTATGGKADGQVNWEAGMGAIDAAGKFTPPAVTAADGQNVTITAYDKTYDKAHYTPVKTEYILTVYPQISIARPDNYVEGKPSTYPLVAGTSITYNVTAKGGPTGNFDWSIIEDRSGSTRVGPVGGGATYGVNIDDLFNNWGAGVYTIRAKTDGFAASEIKIRIPLRIAPMTGVYKDTGPDQNFTVTGHHDPYSLKWAVTNEKGNVDANPAFGSFLASETATNPGVNTFDFNAIAQLTTFRVQAQSTEQALVDAGLDKVITLAQVVKPVLDFKVQVNNSATGAGIEGAVVTAVYDLAKTGTTGNTGLATISNMENTGVTYTFAMTAAGYAPATFTTIDLKQTSTVTLAPIATLGTIGGAVSLAGVPGGTGILVSLNGSGTRPQVLANPITGVYSLTFDTAVEKGPYTVIARNTGYVTNIADNTGVVSATLGQTNADINLPEATKITITDNGGSPTLIYSITATPAFNNTAGEIQIFVGTEPVGNNQAGGATFIGGTYTYSVSTPADFKSASIFVRADTSTAGRDASSGYYATATHTFVSGVTPTGKSTQIIAKPNDGGKATSANGEVNLPPGGVDTLDSVTLTISEATPVSTTTGSALIYIATLTYTATGEPVPNSLIKKIYITIKFDPAKVPAGSLESGARAILQATDLAAMASGIAAVVPPNQIMSVNYATGEVTFWVNHLSVFGIGAGSISEEESKSGCFIATAAFGSKMENHVRILSEFRDRYLFVTKIGSRFVEFYYRHSPPIADYLRQHPVARAAMMYALIPVTGVAYVALKVHPAIFLIAFIFMLAGIVLVVRRYT